MEVIVVVLTIVFALVIRNIDAYYEAKCESLEFRVETLEEEIEILEDYIERNEEKWKD